MQTVTQTNFFRALIGVFISTGLFFSVSASAVKTGQTASAFTLSDGNGKTFSLSDYRGKHVVLEWYNKDCPFVRKHYDTKNMQDLQKKYTAKGVVWLTIVSSAKGKEGFLTPETAKATLKRENAAMTAVLVDANGTVGKLYGATATPNMFVINGEQKLVYAGAIDDKPTAEKADVKTAKNYVAQALDESMAGKPVTEAATVAYGCGVKY